MQTFLPSSQITYSRLCTQFMCGFTCRREAKRHFVNLLRNGQYTHTEVCELPYDSPTLLAVLIQKWIHGRIPKTFATCNFGNWCFEGNPSAIYCTFKRTIRVFIYGFFNYSVTAESDYDHQLHRIPLLC